MKPKISVLIAARKNSKYLAKFMHGYFERTGDVSNTEVLIMLNEHDTWNDELVSFYSGMPEVRFFREDLQLGRAGLHEYFNTLYKHATGDWIIYFCEDHFIIQDGWDERIRQHIMQDGLDPRKVYCLIPKFDNAGAMNQILSRGYIEAMGGKLSQHGNLDSYINDLNRHLFGASAYEPRFRGGSRIYKFDDPAMFHDFTHDDPSPMADSHTQSVISDKGRSMPLYGSPEVVKMIEDDAALIQQAIRDGR